MAVLLGNLLFVPTTEIIQGGFPFIMYVYIAETFKQWQCADT